MRKSVLFSLFSIIFAINAKAGEPNCPDGTLNVSCFKCGDDCTARIDNDGKMTISGTENMYDYGITVGPERVDQYYNQPWKNKNITSVVIEQGIEYIGTSAFVGLSNLKTVSISDSVKSIGATPFAYTGITSVEIPASVTSWDVGTFCCGLTSLQSIVFSDGTTDIPSIAFAGAENLEGIVIPDTVETIGIKAFANTGTTPIYCKKTQANTTSICTNKGSNNITYYEKDENGVYQVDGEYYSSPENMTAGTTCNNNNGDCQKEATFYKNQKAAKMAGGALCQTKAGCIDLINMAQDKKYCTTIASCKAYGNEHGISFDDPRDPNVIQNNDGSTSVFDDYGNLIKRIVPNQDGSTTIFDQNGNIIAYRGKRIYTVEEAARVAKERNRFTLRYK